MGSDPKVTPLTPGDPRRLGAYELTARLGEGGQGIVYLGRDGRGRQVAVKLLHAQLSGDTVARTRFVRELEVAERVAGFCTARVLDAEVGSGGENELAGDRPYIVSEYVPGPSLKEQVEASGPLDAESLVRLAIGTVTALAAVHRAGIVHRDFKPANVLMGPDGPRVIDFGVARALDHSSVTMTSQVVGTPAYMAPEQVQGVVIGPAADLFAWAGTMLYAATGRPPFGGDSIPAVMHRILHAEADLSPLPPVLAGMVGACLAKDPAARPTSDTVLLQLLGQLGAARQPPGGDLLAGAATLVTAARLPPFAPPPYAPQPMWNTAPGVPPRRRRALPWVLAGAGGVMSVVLTLAAVLLVPRVVANDGGGGGGGGAPSASVRLAFLGALSGPAEGVGELMYQGAKAAVDEHNATSPTTRVELVQSDSQGMPSVATARAQSLASSNVAGVIGPGFSSEAATAASLLNSAEVPMVSPGATTADLSQKGWRYWHRVVPGADASNRALAEFMVRAGRVRRVVVVSDRDGWTPLFIQTVRATLQQQGVKVTEVNLDPAAQDLGPLLDGIEDAEPDAIYYPGLFTNAARLIKQARAEGLQTRFYLSDASLADGFVETTGRAQAEGTVLYCSCVAPTRATTEPAGRFLDAYKRSFPGQTPGYYTAEGYDAAVAFLSAIKAGRTGREDINAYLRALDVQGVGQRLRFTENGDLAEAATYVYKVTDGAIGMIGPAATASL